VVKTRETRKKKKGEERGVVATQPRVCKPGSMNRSGNQEVYSSRAVESGFYCLRTVWSLVQETGL
jgi:hypothetical protein